jgi:uncharacterized membrane protein
MYRYSATHPSRVSWLLGGAAAGVLLMYFGDQEHGRRRRAMATDKLRSAAAKSGTAIDVASRDLGNRLQGLRAQASRMIARNNVEVDDDVLVARVRQRIGRATSHPRAVEVAAHQGTVTLCGPVLAHEKQQLIDAVRKVLGVHWVEDRLDEHDHENDVARLQGNGKTRESLKRDNWSPALRAVAAAGGGVLTAYGLARHSALRVLPMLVGAGLLARSLANTPLLQMTGMGGGKQMMLNKTIHIEAAPETVFDMWRQYENFPHFMSHVREVTDLGNGRSHWVVSGPAGVQVEWDAQLTEALRPQVLAWKSEPGASVQNSGTVRFQPDGNGTRVSVHMIYTPPSGYFGHALATLVNGDPKRQMDADLMRMKQFIETGRPPHDAAQPASQQSAAPTDALPDTISAATPVAAGPAQTATP